MNMNGLSQSGYLNSVANYHNVKKDERKKNNALKEETTKKTEGTKDSKLNEVSGRKIGEPKLSDKALKYYEQLKKKYSNMDFILVAPDKMEEAKRNIGTYTSDKELIVLIDADKIERMATDENYRKKYEAILSGATAQVEKMKQSLGTNASRVSAFGMTFDDHGNASFFAVVDKSLALQRERIAEQKEEKAQEKKLEKKLEEKKAEEKQAEEAAAEKSADAVGAAQTGKTDSTDKVTVTAKSWDELLKKIDHVIMSDMADSMRTEAELKVGQKFDFTI